MTILLQEFKDLQTSAEMREKGATHFRCFLDYTLLEMCELTGNRSSHIVKVQLVKFVSSICCKAPCLFKETFKLLEVYKMSNLL